MGLLGRQSYYIWAQFVLLGLSGLLQSYNIPNRKCLMCLASVVNQWLSFTVNCLDRFDKKRKLKNIYNYPKTNQCNNLFAMLRETKSEFTEYINFNTCTIARPLASKPTVGTYFLQSNWLHVFTLQYYKI